MAINRDYVGRTFPSTSPYEVSRVKIAEFADAIGDGDPRCRDAEAARAAGHPDVVAPPTFPIVIAMHGTGQVMADPELGVDYSMVVHSAQRFVSERPLRAGDVVGSTTTITEIRAIGATEVITTESSIDTVEGEHVCTAIGTLAVRAQ